MATQLSLADIDLPSLKGKSVLITGGASGLGHQTAKLFAKSGAYVTIADIQPSEPVVESFKSKSLAVQYVHCDVTDWSQQVVAFKQAINFAPSRSLDIVCCFAAVDKQGHLVDYVRQAEPTVNDDPQPPNTAELEINLKGTLYSTDLALHYLRLPGRPGKKTRRPPPVRSSSSSSSSDSNNENKEEAKEVEAKSPETEPEVPSPTKSLIIVSSMSGYIYEPSHSVYTASKFGTRGLFIGINREAKRKLNIRCNLIAPWAIQTPMTLPILERFEKIGLLRRVESEAKGKEKGAEEPLPNATDETAATTTEVKTEVPEIDAGAPEQEPAPETKNDHEQNASSASIPTPVDAPAVASADVPADIPADIPADAPANMPADEPTPTPHPEAATITTTATTPEPGADQAENSATPSSPDDQPPKNQAILPSDVPPSTSQSGESEPGIKFKGFSFANGEDLANTVAKCCTDGTISGRAFAIMPEGVFDLSDDLEGGYAGDVIRQLMATRKKAGDIFSGTGR